MTAVSVVARRFCMRVLVYERRIATGQSPRATQQGVAWVRLDGALIRDLFAGEPERRVVFERFLAQGHAGIAAVDAQGWVTYGWIALGNGGRPSHLPGWAAGLAWAFYCRTRASARGRGFLRAVLERLAVEAHTQGGASAVYADTTVGNVASRRAILRAGFSPAGQAVIVRAPRTERAFGHWARGLEHPRIAPANPPRGS